MDGKVYLLVISDEEGDKIETISLTKDKAFNLAEEFVRRWNELHVESAALKEAEIGSDKDFTIIWTDHASLIKRWRGSGTFFDIIETVPENLCIEDLS